MPSFPPGFRFGAATAAYQIEGAAHEDGRGESIWDTFCRVPGAIANGDTGDVACDHYHRWREDLDLMAALGLESYRFSISWPRVQPDGAGPLNPAGVRFYRNLVEGLLERGIEPAATLYHWDLPQALQDAGGWANRDTAERFAEYAQHMARELGDLVRTWITHNEPWVATFPGHAQGRFAPGVRDWPTALAVSHHLLLSHGLALPALPGSVGITLNLSPVYPAAPGEEDAARLYDGHLNRWFLDPVLRGAYPQDVLEHFERRVGPIDAIRDGDLELIARPIDFLGVNYYFPSRVRADARAEPLGVVFVGGPAAADGDGLGGRARRPLRAARPSAARLRRAHRDHRERSGLRRSARRQRAGRRPRPRRVPRRPHRGRGPRDRRRRGRPPLLRVVADGQLRVEPRLRQALRDRARRLRHAAAHAQAQRRVVP